MATAVETGMNLLIGGEWVQTGHKFSVRSPYDESTIAEIAWGNRSHARAAIDAAERAMKSPFPLHRRAQILEEVAGKLKERRSLFARTIALEAGKPIAAAGVEVDRAVQTLIFSATAARNLHGDAMALDAHPAGEGRLAVVLRAPVGIVVAITPFNFPLNLVAHKIGPALAAGCACILKPADKAPLSGLLLGELFAEAGLPPGWLNVVVGDAEELANVFTTDERVKAISFTGSAEVGWSLRAKAPKKKVLLELGNSTPVIVLHDADLEQAARAVVAHGFGFGGQTCISIQRVYAESPIYQPLIDKLLPKIEALRTGDPLNPDTQVGPLITTASRDRVLSWIYDAQQQGAKVITGGSLNENGLLRPTLLTDVSPEMSVSCREVFGPVVVVSAVQNLEQAIELANGTPYGLHAGIFTDDVNSALTAAMRLEFGGVTINESPSFRADQMPYGGVKASGNTREGPAYAVEELSERRLVVLRLPNK
jgi:acyl-CoA reductase-like NAD-dependent aldehyde dehydrogenase